MTRLAESLGMSEEESARMLWEQHNPWLVWLVFSLVAASGLAGLLWYYKAKHRRQPGTAK